MDRLDIIAAVVSTVGLIIMIVLTLIYRRMQRRKG